MMSKLIKTGIKKLSVGGKTFFKLYFKGLILFLTIVFISSLHQAFAQNVSEFVNTTEAVTAPINVTVAPKQLVCLFFVSAPSFAPQDEIVIFHTVNVNCGNQPINGTTLIKITNSTHVLKERSRSIFLNNSLDTLPFNLFFSTSVPNGTYNVIATTIFNNGKENITINRTFDVLNATDRLVQRLTVFTPVKIITALDVIILNKTLNVTRGNTLLIPIEVSNEGTVALTNVSVIPIVPSGWNSTVAYIDNLPVIGKVSRTISVTPGLNVLPTSHLILIEGKYNADIMDKDFIIVNVKREGVGGITIEEYPIIFETRQRTPQNFSVVVRNTGNISLTGITITLENEEECLFPYEFPITGELEPDKTRVISAELVPKDVVRSCTVTVIVTSEEDAIATATTTIKVQKRAGFPAVFLNTIITFVKNNPFLVIGIVVLLIVMIRIMNYVRYRIEKMGTEETGEGGGTTPETA